MPGGKVLETSSCMAHIAAWEAQWAWLEGAGDIKVCGTHCSMGETSLALEDGDGL